MELASSHAVLESGMRKERGGLEVASVRGKEARLGGTYHPTEAKVGVEELPADQVAAGVAGVGPVCRGVGHDGFQRWVLKGEEGIWEEI